MSRSKETDMSKTTGQPEAKPTCGACGWCIAPPGGGKIGECYALPPQNPVARSFNIEHDGPAVRLDRRACSLFQQKGKTP
jgi:hypothetical protein